MSVPLVLEELGSDLSRSRESMQKEAQGELGVTWRAEMREMKRRRRRKAGDVPAMVTLRWVVRLMVG